MRSTGGPGRPAIQRSSFCRRGSALSFVVMQGRRPVGSHYRLPDQVLSRRLTALFATAFVLPLAGADECIWPQPEAMTAPPAASGDGVSIKGPDELPVQVMSGGAELTRAGDAKLTDGVVVRQGDRELSAQSATYNATEQSFEVEGDVEFRSPDLRLKGVTGAWGVGGSGRFTGAEFELPTQPARGKAAELDVSSQGALSLREVSFTTCPAGNNDWFLRASSIEIDQRTQLGKGRNVRVELKGVPILYTPLITFPVGDARKSGFLFPTFGNSDKSGFALGVPYYFNLASNYDMTLTPFLLARRGLRAERRVPLPDGTKPRPARYALPAGRRSRGTGPAAQYADAPYRRHRPAALQREPGRCERYAVFRGFWPRTGRHQRDVSGPVPASCLARP